MSVGSVSKLCCKPLVSIAVMSLKAFLLKVGVDLKRDEKFVDAVLKIYSQDRFDNITEVEHLLGLTKVVLEADTTVTPGKSALMVTLCSSWVRFA